MIGLQLVSTTTRHLLGILALAMINRRLPVPAITSKVSAEEATSSLEVSTDQVSRSSCMMNNQNLMQVILADRA